MRIEVKTVVNADIQEVWNCWTDPQHIVKWNFASPDWHTTSATNDVKVGGQFSSRMEAKDGSFGFDFAGTYTKVEPHQLLEYQLGDVRTVQVLFQAQNGQTEVIKSFDAETQHDVEMQRAGWQAILNNFKTYVENR